MSNDLRVEKMRGCIGDVLYLKRLVCDGCFATDAAAVELKTYGAKALPVVEDVIRDSVFSAASGGMSSRELDAKFLGLNGLWMSYFEIAGHEHCDRVVAFLQRAPGVLPFIAVRAAH